MISMDTSNIMLNTSPYININSHITYPRNKCFTPDSDFIHHGSEFNTGNKHNIFRKCMRSNGRKNYSKEKFDNNIAELDSKVYGKFTYGKFEEPITYDRRKKMVEIAIDIIKGQYLNYVNLYLTKRFLLFVNAKKQAWDIEPSILVVKDLLFNS